MEKGLLEEEKEAGVTPVNLTVVAAVVAIERPQVELGMMAMTFVSSVNQGPQPGILLSECSSMETVSIPNVWDNSCSEKGEEKPSNSAQVNCSSYFKTLQPPSL